MYISRREALYNACWWIHVLCFLLIILIAFILVIPEDVFGSSNGFIDSWVHAAVKNTKEFGKVELASLTVLLGLSKLLCNQVGPGWVWNAVEGLLTEFRKHSFTKVCLESEQYCHRVTLFQYVTYRHWWFLLTARCWIKCFRFTGLRGPWSGWLIVVRRSGNAKKRTNLVFLACDDGENAEGLAGRAFRGCQTYIVKQLPEITATSVDTDIAEYAKKTYVTVAWVKKRLEEKKTLARSLAAIPIEVDNKPWGVIVIDSTEPTGVSIQANAKDVALFMLGKLLKR